MRSARIVSPLSGIITLHNVESTKDYCFDFALLLVIGAIKKALSVRPSVSVFFYNTIFVHYYYMWVRHTSPENYNFRLQINSFFMSNFVQRLSLKSFFKKSIYFSCKVSLRI